MDMEIPVASSIKNPIQAKNATMAMQVYWVKYLSFFWAKLTFCALPAEASGLVSALGSALLSVLDSALDSALLSDSDSALELPDDVLDDADDELLVLWEELPELAEEDEEDVLPEGPAWDEDELLVEPDSLVTPLPIVMVRVLLLTLQSL